MKEAPFDGSVEVAAIEEDVAVKASEENEVVNDWECPQCGYSCFIARSDCFKCGAYRPLDDIFIISEGVPPKTQVDKE